MMFPAGYVYVSKSRCKRVVAIYKSLQQNPHWVANEPAGYKNHIDALETLVFVSDGDLVMVNDQIANMIYWVLQNAHAVRK